MEFAERLGNIVHVVFGGGIPSEGIQRELAPFLGSGIKLSRCKRGTFIAHAGQDIGRISILVNGCCYIYICSAQGKSVMTGACKAPQIFGLYESLDGIQAHTATIEALTPCWLLEVSAKEYLSCLENETQIMRYSLRYLAAFIGRILNKNDQMLLNTPRQNLLLYFYERCGGAQFPVRLPVEKAALAEELNLNLRTLYRKLRAFREEGMIGGEKGKVVISREQYLKIQDSIRELL